jgi:hypothetical protein
MAFEIVGGGPGLADPLLLQESCRLLHKQPHRDDIWHPVQVAITIACEGIGCVAPLKGMSLRQENGPHSAWAAGIPATSVLMMLDGYR